jgi:hypothetical protein
VKRFGEIEPAKAKPETSEFTGASGPAAEIPETPSPSDAVAANRECCTATTDVRAGATQKNSAPARRRYAGMKVAEDCSHI